MVSGLVFKIAGLSPIEVLKSCPIKHDLDGSTILFDMDLHDAVLVVLTRIDYL